MVKFMHWIVHGNRLGQKQEISLEIDSPRFGLRRGCRRSASLRLLDYRGALVKAR